MILYKIYIMIRILFFLLLLFCAICSTAQTTYMITTQPDSSTQFKSYVSFQEKNLVQIKVKPDVKQTFQLGKGQNILPNIFTIDAPLDHDAIWVIEYTAKKAGTVDPPDPTTTETVDANAFTGLWKKDASGVFSFSNTTGQTLSYSFNGKAIKLIALKNNSYGKISIQLNSQTPVLIDLYAASLIKEFTIFDTAEQGIPLLPGTNIVTLKVTGQKKCSGYEYLLCVGLCDNNEVKSDRCPTDSKIQEDGKRNKEGGCLQNDANL